jgi:membrane protease YdiL (CAAX protease family)
VPRVRWGLPDAFVAWIVGVVLSLVVAVPFLNADGKIASGDKVVATLVLLVAQDVGVMAWLLGVARMKGLGTLRADFGLWFRWVDLAWVPVGIVVFALASALILPISDLAGLDDSSQEVVKTFERSSGALEQVAFVLGVAALTPIVEELLFRGVLLRALLRRTTPAWSVLISALTFALVHFLGDAGTGYYVPAFLALGLVSGWAAVVTRRLGPSIALHAGFNLISAIIIVS